MGDVLPYFWMSLEDYWSTPTGLRDTAHAFRKNPVCTLFLYTPHNSMRQVLYPIYRWGSRGSENK